MSLNRIPLVGVPAKHQNAIGRFSSYKRKRAPQTLIEADKMDTLPDELVQAIILYRVRDSATILALDRVSRRLHRLARDPTVWERLLAQAHNQRTAAFESSGHGRPRDTFPLGYERSVGVSSRAAYWCHILLHEQWCIPSNIGMVPRGYAALYDATASTVQCGFFNKEGRLHGYGIVAIVARPHQAPTLDLSHTMSDSMLWCDHESARMAGCAHGARFRVYDRLFGETRSDGGGARRLSLFVTARYEGFFKDARPCGQGRWVCATSESLVRCTQWSDCLCGDCLFRSSERSSAASARVRHCRGQWRDGKPYRLGTAVYGRYERDPDAEHGGAPYATYVGGWDRGAWHGVGDFHCPSTGERICGQFDQGLVHGRVFCMRGRNPVNDQELVRRALFRMGICPKERRTMPTVEHRPIVFDGIARKGQLCEGLTVYDTNHVRLIEHVDRHPSGVISLGGVEWGRVGGSVQNGVRRSWSPQRIRQRAGPAPHALLRGRVRDIASAKCARCRRHRQVDVQCGTLYRPCRALFASIVVDIRPLVGTTRDRAAASVMVVVARRPCALCPHAQSA